MLNNDYPSGDAWVESHYRWAVKGMAEGDEPEVVIAREAALTPKGRPATSLKEDVPFVVELRDGGPGVKVGR